MYGKVLAIHEIIKKVHMHNISTYQVKYKPSTPLRNELLCQPFRALRYQWISANLAPMAIEKIKILGAVLELPAKQHCQSSPFT